MVLRRNVGAARKAVSKEYREQNRWQRRRPKRTAKRRRELGGRIDAPPELLAKFESDRGARSRGSGRLTAAYFFTTTAL